MSSFDFTYWTIPETIQVDVEVPFTSVLATPTISEVEALLADFFEAQDLRADPDFIEVSIFNPLPPTQVIIVPVLTCPTAPGPSVGDPVVFFVYPPLGQGIRSGTSVVFRAIVAFYRRIFVKVSYPSRPDLRWEVFHDGTRFGPRFQGPGNRRSTLSSPVIGFEYQGLRMGGWPAPPRFDVFAISVTGKEAS